MPGFNIKIVLTFQANIGTGMIKFFEGYFIVVYNCAGKYCILRSGRGKEVESAGLREVKPCGFVDPENFLKLKWLRVNGLWLLLC